ncbi:MAG: sensor histidine kinase [Actinomycetota bacterium]|nr:sensor histidine kinase [Actinomycetota bacterium]
MSRIAYVPRKYRFDLLIALLAIAAMLEVVVGRDSPGAPRSLWFALPAIAIMVLPIFARRRFPFGGPTTFWVLSVAVSFVDWRLIPFAVSLFVVGLAVAFLLGNLRNAYQAGIGLVIAVAGSAIVTYNIPGHSVDELVFIPLEFAIAWVAGFALRERVEQAEAAEMRAALAERERDAAARIAVAEERARIARELHDVVAHAVSVMVLQVGAVRHKLPDALAEDRDALGDVERAGRTALAEMRQLLAAMRRDGDEAELVPQPGLDGLDALLKEIERAGLPVELHLAGDAVPLSRGIDLSAYRIIQEGLTNALKHAHAPDADVTVRYRPDGVEIEVRDNGQGASANDGLGHGLVGIRERVKIYGGEMTAGSENGDGFVLRARLPLSPSSQ